MISPLPFTPPVPTPETAAFWAAVNQRRLLFGLCRACGKPHYYPRRICPWCGSDTVDWVDAAGSGVVHSFSIVRGRDGIHVLAYVTLAEGVTLMTNIIDVAPELIAIGDPVTVKFLPAADGQMVPFFAVSAERPAPSDDE